MFTNAANDNVSAITFDAWEHTEDEWRPPATIDEWTSASPNAVVVNVAWRLLYKTKPELIETVQELEGAGILDETLDNIQHSINFFSAFVKVLQAAQARLFCAGLSIDAASATG